jgi:hypothetical protein
MTYQESEFLTLQNPAVITCNLNYNVQNSTQCINVSLIILTVHTERFPIRYIACLVLRKARKVSIKFLPHTLHVCGRNLTTRLTSAVSPRVDISSTCKVGQKLGVSLPLLTCSYSAWPSRLLYRRGRKSRRDLCITLYMCLPVNPQSAQAPEE